MVTDNYAGFLSTKRFAVATAGVEVPTDRLHPKAHAFQRDLTRWALRRGRCAIFAQTGMGKTLMELMFAQEAARRGFAPLIMAPLAVARQTVREGEKWGIPVTYARSQAQAGTITITNYEMVEHFDAAAFGAVVLDECFPAGTQIDSPTGKKPIEEFQVGDAILNAFGVDVVADIHKREIQYAVRVTVAGQRIISSPNHPYFTSRGWIGAQDLRPGDAIVATTQAVRMVRGHIPAEVLSGPEQAILQSVLLSEMAHESAGAFGEGAYGRGCGEARREKERLVRLAQPAGRSREGSDQGAQSDGEPRDSGESLQRLEGHEAQTFRAWGQRAWIDQAASGLAGCTRTELAGGISFVVGRTDSRLSDRLQARLSRSREANQYRSGWSIPPQPEGRGPEERREGALAGVDGIEILESGHPDLERYRSDDGRLYFYDLGATRHPSFSVTGLLVHNSSILKDYNSATRNRLIAKFAKTPMRLCASATPAPNDIAEIANHAEFLGVMTRVEMLATFFTHDDDGWRLRKHAHEPFWRWLASWGMTLRKPSDLGYPDDGYDLPPLVIESVIVPSDYTPEGQLFDELHGVGDRSKVRRATLDERVKAAVHLVNTESTAACGSQSTPRSVEPNTSLIPMNELGDGTSLEAPKPTATTCSPTTVRTKSGGQGIGRKTGTSGIVGVANGMPPIPNTEKDACNKHEPAVVTKIAGGIPDSGRSSASAPSNTTRSSNDKRAAAEYAEPSSETPKVDASTLTIATQAAESEGSCVPSVISESGSSEMNQACSERPQNTSQRAEPWVIWCGLNDEQTALERAFGTRAVSVHGALSPDEKLARLDMWLNGERPILISKPAILGHGINMQHCARMVFVGLGDSFEQYFQSIRRCYRYGQTREVRVAIVLTDLEQAIHHNVLRKEAEAERMGAELVRHVARFERAEIGKLDDQQGEYRPTQVMRVPDWLRRVA